MARRKVPYRNILSLAVIPAIAVPEIKKYATRKEWEQVVWRLLVKDLTATQPVKLISILNSLITERERHDIVLRIAAIHRLRSGKTYEAISDELWLSSQTISAITKTFNERTYRSYYERGKAERKKRVWSPGPSRQYDPARDPSKRRVRTKYGTMYLPR